MTFPQAPIYIHSVGITCALGSDIQRVERALFAQAPQSPLHISTRYSEFPVRLGQVADDLPNVDVPGEDSRNNRILAQALQPLRADINALKSQFGAHRIGVILGSSTSGVAETEQVMRFDGERYSLPEAYDYRTQELYAPARFASRSLGLSGPCWTVSTACTSGSKALASAARLLRLGVCDAVVAGGVDSLCKMTVNGFASLAVTTDSQCNPFSVNRSGINIGEGAAVFILSRDPASVRLLGWGETSDAHHISSPEPDGRGAEAAMRAALQSAELEANAIDYLNLHGTATRQNDEMEAKAVYRVFGSEIACGSTKSLTGHTLAAAGAIEAAFCWLGLQRNDGQLPPQLWDGQADPALPVLNGLARRTVERPLRYAMSNSFAFGGNNLSLIMGRERSP